MPRRQYLIKGAARYLGISLRQLRYYYYEKDWIRPDGKLGTRTWFYQDTLNALREWLQNNNIRRDALGRIVFTSSEVAQKLGISRQLFHYHLKKGHIIPDTYIGDRPMFFQRTAEDLRKMFQSKTKTEDNDDHLR